MAVIVGVSAKQGIMAGTIRLSVDTIKAMIVDNTFSQTAAQLTFIDDGTANDPLSHETTASGYTGAFGGASRIALGTKTFTGDPAMFKFAPVVWAALGGSVLQSGIVIYKPVTNDADSIVIAWDDTPNITTTGLDVTYTCHASGLFGF